MSTEPKPATGEFPDINEIVMDLRQAAGSLENLHRAFFNILKPIYDAHNAALAAERELLYRIGRRMMESQATGEPLNLDLLRQEIDALLYPPQKPERFA